MMRGMGMVSRQLMMPNQPQLQFTQQPFGAPQPTINAYAFQQPQQIQGMSFQQSTVPLLMARIAPQPRTQGAVQLIANAPLLNTAQPVNLSAAGQVQSGGGGSGSSGICGGGMSGVGGAMSGAR